MTFQEAYKNGNLGLVTRRGLTEDELSFIWTKGMMKYDF